ncbi:hypothetical protein [Catenulispora acidiphila]|uniref:hypothetical protein n=1 Tax=Catenulispora acidiphila TaxID=304895 RepID=UPI00117C2E3A|nr:hypothetical protein [Catenulispora acidiphila]
MTGTLTQAPNRSTSHRATTNGTSFSDHLTHIPRAPRGTTPNILRAATAAAGVFALIAAVALSGAASGARAQISTVRATDAPSVRATDDFLFRLQDMDAQLVNALLVNGDTGMRVPRGASEALFDTDRKAADGDLEAATAALSGDQSALEQLHTVADGFGQYQEQSVRTLADDERDGGTAAGGAPPSVFADYLIGHALLFGDNDDSGLMKSATDLEAASKNAISASASSANDSLSTVLAEFVIFGALLVGGLLALQAILFRRFHRMLNPALAAATAVALILMIAGIAGTAGAAEDFHTAKSDAFDSVLALSEANATSAGINSDESRWLLAQNYPEQLSEYENSFLRGENKIADVPNGSSVTDYAGSLDGQKLITDVNDVDQTSLTPNSSFGKELANITFPGEADQALAAFRAYCDYIKDDAKLRAMPSDPAGGLKAAINFDTNADAPGSSDQAFTAYSKALGDVIATNEAHFESSMPAAENGIGTWTWLPYLFSLLLIGLTVLGMRPRLTEYR